jgi:hypothetical protein
MDAKMKDAYSNFLSSFITADELTYDQIISLQMVCPCCREPVFKVHREVPAKAIDFFSHHKSQMEIPADCERRVATISDGDRETVNRASRGQSLRLFKSVIRDALAFIPIHGERFTPDNTPLIRGMADELAYMVRYLDHVGELTNFVSVNESVREQFGTKNLTKFEKSFRSQIAADLLLTLATDTSSKSFTHIVERALKAIHKPGLGRHLTDSAKATIAAFESRNFQPNALPKFLQDAEDPANEFNICMLLIDSMLRQLHQIPYLKIIGNAKQNRAPLFDLTVEDFILDEGATLNDDQENEVYSGPKI